MRASMVSPWAPPLTTSRIDTVFMVFPKEETMIGAGPEEASLQRCAVGPGAANILALFALGGNNVDVAIKHRSRASHRCIAPRCKVRAIPMLKSQTSSGDGGDGIDPRLTSRSSAFVDQRIVTLLSARGNN